jgi:hypothetical protein
MPLAYAYAAHGGNGALDAAVGQLDRGWQHKPGAAYAERVGDRAALGVGVLGAIGQARRRPHSPAVGRQNAR